MKKRIFSAAFLLMISASVFGWFIPETINGCINPTENYPNAQGYCNNISVVPGIIVFRCESQMGGLGQTKNCIGNLPSVY